MKFSKQRENKHKNNEEETFLDSLFNQNFRGPLQQREKPLQQRYLKRFKGKDHASFTKTLTKTNLSMPEITKVLHISNSDICIL